MSPKTFKPTFTRQAFTTDGITNRLTFPESLHNGIERGMTVEAAIKTLEDDGFKCMKVEPYGDGEKYTYIKDLK